MGKILNQPRKNKSNSKLENPDEIPEVSQFFGVCEFLPRFISGYLSLTAPLLIFIKKPRFNK